MTSAEDGMWAAYRQANELIDLGRSEDAQRIVERALGSHPDSPDLLCTLARCLIDSTQFDRADDVAKRVVALSPDNEWPHRLLSMSAQQRGDVIMGVAHAYNAVKLNPEEPRVYLVLTDALLLAGNVQEADDAVQKLRAMEPDDGWTWYRVGNVERAKQRHREAELAYRRCLQLMPEESLAINCLGISLENQGRVVEALDCYRRATLINPRIAVFRENAARLAAEVGSESKMTKWLRQKFQTPGSERRSDSLARDYALMLLAPLWLISLLWRQVTFKRQLRHLDQPFQQLALERRFAEWKSPLLWILLAMTALIILRVISRAT